MISATRRLEIDAGHRLLRHAGKCKNYHGHRYAFELTVAAPKLDEVGRVIDFSEVKARVGGWLDEAWDHAMLLETGDSLIPFLVGAGLRHAVLPCSPTAENLAVLVLAEARRLLAPLEVLRVRCYETPNCWADAT